MESGDQMMQLDGLKSKFGVHREVSGQCELKRVHYGNSWNLRCFQAEPKNGVCTENFDLRPPDCIIWSPLSIHAGIGVR